MVAPLRKIKSKQVEKPEAVGKIISKIYNFLLYKKIDESKSLICSFDKAFRDVM